MDNLIFKGVELTPEDMQQISDHYKAANVADYLMENHGITSKEKALILGYEINRQIRDKDLSEEEAIELVLQKDDFERS